MLDADRPVVGGSGVIGDVLVAHALDDGSVPPDDVVGCLLHPFAALEVLRAAECVVCGYLGLVRSAFGDVKNELVDDTGLSAGETVGVRGDPDRPGKTVSAHGSTSSIAREGHGPTIDHGLIAQASDAAGQWISPRFHPGHLAVPRVA